MEEKRSEFFSKSKMSEMRYFWMKNIRSRIKDIVTLNLFLVLCFATNCSRASDNGTSNVLGLFGLVQSLGNISDQFVTIAKSTMSFSSIAKDTETYSQAYAHFESAHVRPLALSSDGSILVAVNTPDSRIVIYKVSPEGLEFAGEVSVGLEPVSVAMRSIGGGVWEAWVVNHLSDSVSIVRIESSQPNNAKVTRTLFVGDEPRDIIFAGTNGSRAFITAAHRGQNIKFDPKLTTDGIGRADVWVFDTANLGIALGGTPIAVLQLFGDTPRALASSPDGKTVYAAVFMSGNQTTTIPEPLVTSNGGLPPAPAGSTANPPKTGLIVKYKDGKWKDEIGRDWSKHVPFSLPDKDVFRIDAISNPPKLSQSQGEIKGVGTVLFNMAVHPNNGKLYVSNTEARNEVRFENVLNGSFSQSRVSIVSGTSVSPIHLNPHIDYSTPTGSAEEISKSISQPTQIIFNENGQTVYIAGFGSGKIAMYESASLESGTVDPKLVQVGLGPSGIVLDKNNQRLYVMNRIDHNISILDHANDRNAIVETSRIPLPFDPVPTVVRQGQVFLYDASRTSGHGDVSCASCHVFGDMDSIAWDLGNPYGQVLPNPNTKINVTGVDPIPYHPMKGPMTTQSLRGMADAGPMHWRGDKTGGLTSTGEIDPNGDPMDESAAFKQFNGAFTNLQGRSAQLSSSEMQSFTDFVLKVRYPPNPVHNLDNSDTEAEARGRQEYMNDPDFGGTNTCNSCHALPLTTNGFLAAAGLDPLEQDMKIPHFRNLYQKVGMFGLPRKLYPTYPASIVGDQVRGFGFAHDGGVSTIFNFLQNLTFNFGPIPQPIPNPFTTDEQEQTKRDLEQFLLGLDTGLRPIVGQQVTLDSVTVWDTSVQSRIQLLISRTQSGDCDLILKGFWNNKSKGAVYNNGQFTTDKSGETPLSLSQIYELANVPGQVLTLSAVPPGNGVRAGIDRDLDGILDGDE